MAVSENIIERLESRDRLILTEGGQQVRELVLGNIELPHGFRQGDEHRMFRSALIAVIQFPLPLIEQNQRGSRIPHFIPEIVGNSAIGINVEEMLP